MCVCVSIETNTQTTTVDMLTVVQLLPLYNNKLFRTLYPLIEYKKKLTLFVTMMDDVSIEHCLRVFRLDFHP